MPPTDHERDLPGLELLFRLRERTTEALVDGLVRAQAESILALDGVLCVGIPAASSAPFRGLVIVVQRSGSSSSELDRSVARRLAPTGERGLLCEAFILDERDAHGDPYDLPARVRRAIGLARFHGDSIPALPDARPADAANDALDGIDASVAATRLFLEGAETMLAHSGPAAVDADGALRWLGTIAAEALSLDTVDPTVAILRTASFAKGREALRDVIDQLCRKSASWVRRRFSTATYLAAAKELLEAIGDRMPLAPRTTELGPMPALAPELAERWQRRCDVRARIRIVRRRNAAGFILGRP